MSTIPDRRCPKRCWSRRFTSHSIRMPSISRRHRRGLIGRNGLKSQGRKEGLELPNFLRAYRFSSLGFSKGAETHTNKCHRYRHRESQRTAAITGNQMPLAIGWQWHQHGLTLIRDCGHRRRPACGDARHGIPSWDDKRRRRPDRIARSWDQCPIGDVDQRVYRTVCVTLKSKARIHA